MTGCESLAAAALFACLARNPDCLPVQYRHLESELRPIAEQESGIRPWTVRDEAAHEGRFFASYEAAVRFAAERDALGHVVGLGMFQITGRENWQAHGLTISTGLQPCANMRAGAEHYAANLRSAALQLYNSGRIGGAPGYAASVMRRAGMQATPAAQPPVLSPHTADTSIYVREASNVRVE